MMAIDFSAPFSVEDINKDLSLRFLAKALPGICISSPQPKSIWDARKSPISSISSQPYSYAFSPPITPPLSPPASSYEPAWSDAESTYVSDSDWPDWSRWSRRNSTSSQSSQLSQSSQSSQFSQSSQCTALTALSDDGPSSKPQIPKTPDLKPADKVPSSEALHPAKTGFALWVGNLSSRTTLHDLCELFGTPDLQSIYLIQRTGCAFVNYNTKEALDLAIQLFSSRGGKLYDHDLVIKAQYSNESDQDSSTSGSESDSPASCSPNRYFICKSLMVDDLEEAKQTEQWSTQLRNKDKFNAAFFSCENTYLVFSANRTSAFYGIARLESPFKEGDATSITDSPGKDSGASSEPEITPTPAFTHLDGVTVPAGKTVFDPLRGSQFWKVNGCQCIEPETEKWTAPAKITWLSSVNSVVPFARTRQLKNSLNMNKPIKVARDGTEIDPLVGEKLRKMFD